MFKHLLLPTDGSDLSRQAVEHGVSLAKALGARVTAVHVVPKFHALTYQPEMLEDTHDEYLKHAKVKADGILDRVQHWAGTSGVACDSVYVMDDHVHRAIIAAAEKNDCDLILMASHGRRGIEGLLLGSETQKVLTHSRIPVLVYR